MLLIWCNTLALDTVDISRKLLFGDCPLCKSVVYDIIGDSYKQGVRTWTLLSKINKWNAAVSKISLKVKSAKLITAFHGWHCVSFWLHFLQALGPLFRFPLSHWCQEGTGCTRSSSTTSPKSGKSSITLSVANMKDHLPNSHWSNEQYLQLWVRRDQPYMLYFLKMAKNSPNFPPMKPCAVPLKQFVALDCLCAVWQGEVAVYQASWYLTL